MPTSNTSTIAWFSDLGLADIDQVGGKNASLGEMVRNLTSAGVRVPDGFATTADAYRMFISDGDLGEMINTELAALDPDNVERLWQWVVGSATRLPSNGFQPIWKPTSGLHTLGWPKTQVVTPVISCHSRCGPVQQPRTCRMPRSMVSRRRFSM